MFKFRTEGYNGYSVQFSPFFENKLACAASANFGLVGNGRLYVLDTGVGPAGIAVSNVYDTQDGLYDVAWSEQNENQLATSSGDGSVKLWDVNAPQFPISNWQEHQREVFSVNWNFIKKDTFITSSWDHTIKLWSPQSPTSLMTFAEHSHCVYNASWSPTNPDMFASASGDQTVKLWDTKMPNSVQTIRAHANEVLALDWNKYREGTIVTGSVDNTAKVWDIRFPDRPVTILRGHEFAIRNVKCSPHHGDLVATTSYDMTTRFWDITKSQQVHVHDLHTEFVLGLDFNLYREGQVATCAWDEHIHIFNPPC